MKSIVKVRVFGGWIKGRAVQKHHHPHHRVACSVLDVAVPTLKTDGPILTIYTPYNVLPRKDVTYVGGVVYSG